MNTIRKSFMEAIKRRREYIDLVEKDKIRSFEVDQNGHRTDVTDRMVADAKAVIAMYEQELQYLGNLAD